MVKLLHVLLELDCESILLELKQANTVSNDPTATVANQHSQYLPLLPVAP